MKPITLLKRILTWFAVVLMAILLLGAGGYTSDDITGRARTFTRDKEVNFVEWTVDALGRKLGQMALGSEEYLSEPQRRQIVTDYLKLVRRIQIDEAQLHDIYSDPNITDPETASSDLRLELTDLRTKRNQIAPLAEAILQEQISAVAGQLGLTIGGQPIPPVLFHSSELPWALIVRPN
jgi:hypothetical protein